VLDVTEDPLDHSTNASGLLVLSACCLLHSYSFLPSKNLGWLNYSFLPNNGCCDIPFHDWGSNFSLHNWFLPEFLNLWSSVFLSHNLLMLLVNHRFMELVDDLTVLLMNHRLVNLSNLLLVYDWLDVLMNYVLMMLMNHILMMFMDNLLMMLMHDILMVLLHNRGIKMSLHSSRLLVCDNLSCHF
jgi:hypothetical protein